MDKPATAVKSPLVTVRDVAQVYPRALAEIFRFSKMET
jgi:hypothetical protein